MVPSAGSIKITVSVDDTVELHAIGIISISTWIFIGSISNAHTDVTTASQRFLSVIFHHYVSDVQFKVLDVLTDMPTSLGYQLLGLNKGFSPFLAAVTGFKLFAHLELNLEQAAGLFSWLPMSDLKHLLYSVCYIDV
ncbi:hypothetical protein BU17DRAFT_94441 [Hysterangium stoloniferum]|nr:hypothetical protein BU17DRAFT_94441 [Hysterangium stoloniferum]